MKQIVLIFLLTSCGPTPERTLQPTPGPLASDRPEAGLLTLAVIAGDGARVDRLLDLGADVNENVGSPSEAITPLFAAVATGNSPMAISLAIRGASFEARSHGYSALDFAVWLGMEGVVSSLILRGKP